MSSFPIGLVILLGLFCLAIGILLLIAAVTSGPRKLETRAPAPAPGSNSEFSGRPSL